MAYVKGYEYDIFISYSHLDNQKNFSQAQGWIENFCSELNQLISQRIGMPDAIKIWWDNRKLDGNIVFDQSIANSINQSAILLCLTSTAYLRSDYCKKELELFYNKTQKESTGLKVGDRSRIVNVLLNNIPYSKWPAQFSGSTGFIFNDAKDNEDLGDPFNPDDQQFSNKLKELRNALIKLMDEFPREETGQLVSAVIAETKKSDDSFSIYFGEVADSLNTTRKRTIAELEKKGYRILCDTARSLDEPDCQKSAKEKIAAAGLSVHLLDQYPGREIEDTDGQWYPQKQAELSLQVATATLVWVPAEMDMATVEDELYREFLQELESGKRSAENFEYIRGAKSTLTQEISDFAEKLKTQQKVPMAKGKVAILLDAYSEDQKYAWALGTSLLENKIQPFVTPQEDDPRDNSNMLGDRISQVNKLVFFYGKVDWIWVQRRINAALKLIINNQYPADEFFIFMLPPHKNVKDISFDRRFLKVNVIDNSDMQQLDEIVLGDFLKSLNPAE